MGRTGCATYEITYVLPEGERVTKTRVGAPDPLWIWQHRPKGALLAVRFMPSTGLWRVWDLRTFKLIHNKAGTSEGLAFYPKPAAETSDLDAAIMAATLLSAP